MPWNDNNWELRRVETGVSFKFLLPIFKYRYVIFAYYVIVNKWVIFMDSEGFLR